MLEPEQDRPRRTASSRLRGAVLAIAMAVSACAHGPAAQPVPDPLEPVNRFVFEFNRIVDGLVLRPASEIYGYLVPDPGKRAVSNFLDNLRAPVLLANHLMQGEREQAGITLGRFMINSTLGLLGLFDFASVVGYPHRRDADFGQTLGTYGVGGGFYLVLPLLGPSTLRDAGGTLVDAFLLDPTVYLTDTSAQLARRGAEAVDTRYRYGPVLDDLEASSLDFYAAARSAYLQRRAAQIRGTSPGGEADYESIFDEAFEDE